MIIETVSHLEIDERKKIEITKSDLQGTLLGVDSIVQTPIHKRLKMDMDSSINPAKECAERKKNRRNRRRKNQKANNKDGMQSMDETDIMPTQSLSNERHVQGKYDNLKNVEHELEQEVEGSSVVDENPPSERHSGTKHLSSDAEQRKNRRNRRMNRKDNDKDGLQSMDQTDITSRQSLSNGHHAQGKYGKLKKVKHELEQEVEGSSVVDENTPSERPSGRKHPSSDSERKKNRRNRRMNQKANDIDDLQIMDQTDIISTRSLSVEHHVQGKYDNLKRVEHELDQDVDGSSGTKHPSQDAKQKKNRRNRKRMNRKANDKDGQQSMDQTGIILDTHHVLGKYDKLKRVEHELEQDVEGSSFVDDENAPSERQSRTKHPSSDAEVSNHVSLAVVVKEVDKLLKVSHSSPERTLVSFSRRKLLILDLNGLLADIVTPPPKECESDINISRRAIFKRPFCYDFLKFCFERFDVGIWSSRSKKIIDRVVDYLLGDMKHKLLFCWDLSHCTETRFKTLENKHKPIVFKELRKIWEINDPNFPWEKGDYNVSNTLLLDDSPYKALLNPIHTAIFPHPYNFKDRSDTSLGPGGDLRVYLEDLARAENVQKYIEQHPFGQSGIDKTSSFWAFYSMVLRSRSILSAKF